MVYQHMYRTLESKDLLAEAAKLINDARVIPYGNDGTHISLLGIHRRELNPILRGIANGDLVHPVRVRKANDMVNEYLAIVGLNQSYDEQFPQKAVDIIENMFAIAEKTLKGGPSKNNRLRKLSARAD